MTIKKILLLALTLFVTACANTIQSASISEAYKKYELQQFEQTLELSTRAENARDTSLEMNPN
jgi:hypothetical protein